MALHCRPVAQDELARCQALTAAWGRGVHSAATLAALPEVWRQLLAERRLAFYVFIDDDEDPTRKVQGYVTAGFASDAWADEVANHDRPWLCRQLAEATLRGDALLLDRAAQARANGGAGVNAFGLDFALADSDWYLPRVMRWFPWMEWSLRDWLAGWRLRSVVREMFGFDTYLLARGAGYPLLRDLRRAVPDDTPLRERPYLCGAYRERALRRPSSVLGRLFMDQAPVFDFNDGERELLELALRTLADEDIAERLHLSPHTIKVRWRRIFDEVQRARPGLLPDDGGAQGQGRGSEKRRHLLAYLREHPEETRPREVRRV